jgi:multiple sugar transport system ATP-binding protein
MLDIPELLDRRPTQLSGGQQQRVAIGRTLVLDPDVFLLDEPLASLDAKLRVEIREELQQLQEKVGITTIYVTHDQEQAMTMSDRIAVMNDGSLQQFASPTEVYRNPVNRFVANFIGTPSMNFFDCTVESTESGVAADIGFTRVPLDEQDPTVSALVGDEAVLGVRPEHVEVVDGEGTGAAEEFLSRVRLVEPTGADKIVHFESGDVGIKAIVPEGQVVERGEEYTLRFNPERMNVFEASGRSITAPGPVAAD